VSKLEATFIVKYRVFTSLEKLSVDGDMVISDCVNSLTILGVIMSEELGACCRVTAMGLEVFPARISGMLATVIVGLYLGATSINVLGRGSYRSTSVPSRRDSL